MGLVLTGVQAATIKPSKKRESKKERKALN
jgi:hypothetical protein